jgi:hypothetical protein
MPKSCNMSKLTYYFFRVKLFQSKTIFGGKRP